MKRRSFLRSSIGTSLVAGIGPTLLLPRKSSGQDVADLPDLVAVRNGEPAAMVDRALAAIGGIQRFVPKGAKVVVKPNIGWPRAPETGANTNPEIVGRVVQACVQAGAKQVYVFDHTVGERRADCYSKSGIEDAAKANGASVAPASQRRYYQKIVVPGARRLADTDVHELVLEADVLINIPVCKHHKGSRATLAMKNLMGVVWDRGAYHKQGLHECISDFCLYHKPTLNIVDAYRVTMDNGPQQARPEDVKLQKMLIVSPDIVAADAAAIRILGGTAEEAQHIKLGHDKKIGTMDLDSLRIRRIAL